MSMTGDDPQRGMPWAILSLALAVFSLVLRMPLLGIMAIAFGEVFRRQNQESQGKLSGREMALAGTVLGALAFVIVFSSVFTHPSESGAVRERPRKVRHVEQVQEQTVVPKSDTRVAPVQGASLFNEDLFIEVASPQDFSNVKVGDKIQLYYYLFTRYDTRYEGFEVEPSFPGFWINRIPAEVIQKEPHETVERNGKKYLRGTVAMVTLNPIFSGPLVIHPGTARVSFQTGSGKRQDGFLKIEPIELNVAESDDEKIPKFVRKVRKIVSTPFSGEGAREGSRMTILLDASGSMLAQDFFPENRFEAVKSVVLEFYRLHPEVSVSVIPFSGKPARTLSLSSAEDLEILERTDPSLNQGEGTAMGDALFQAIQEIEQTRFARERIVLISDGGSNAGHLDPQTVRAMAKLKGLSIHALGIGREGPSPFPVEDPSFGQRMVQAQIPLEEALLKNIAEETGGRYFRCEKSEDLEEALQEIASVEGEGLQI